MTIRQLSLTDFRNLRSTTLDFHPRLNLIHGPNGSGKTSLLEAIHVLCSAASFRASQLKTCIAHEKSELLLFGRFDGFNAGLSRSQDSLNIKMNGAVVNRRSDLASKIPINIVDHESFALIDGTPQNRRQFLDWGLFHVEQDYRENWAMFRHALKQRNKLLKSRQAVQETLPYWDQHIIGPSVIISRLRDEWCKRVALGLQEAMQQLAPGIELELAYRRGWPQNQALDQLLVATQSRDIRMGHTSVGIHRDDIDLLVAGKPAQDVLSRGQQKRVCLALLVASLRLVKQQTGKPIILLIDDMNAEMDLQARELVMELINSMDMQLFVTNVVADWPKSHTEDCKMFHVEHGTIKPQKIS